MGQKLAAYDTDPGPVTTFFDSVDNPPPPGVSVIPITDVEWITAVTTPGFTVADGSLVAPPAKTAAELLLTALAQQTALLTAGCSAAIVAGFTSDSLGSGCNYPSTLTDQQNQNTVANCPTGGKLWCESNGTWSFVDHSQTQAEGVIASFAAWLNSCQSQLVDLTAQINAGTTIESVQAVAWTNPAAA